MRITKSEAISHLKQAFDKHGVRISDRDVPKIVKHGADYFLNEKGKRLKEEKKTSIYLIFKQTEKRNMNKRNAAIAKLQGLAGWKEKCENEINLSMHWQHWLEAKAWIRGELRNRGRKQAIKQNGKTTTAKSDAV